MPARRTARDARQSVRRSDSACCEAARRAPDGALVLESSPHRARRDERTASVGQRRHAQGGAMAREDRVHRRLQEPRRRPSPRRQAQRGRRRPGRSRRARWRAASRLRLPDRLLSLLGARAWTKRLRLRAVRRELHGGWAERRRGLHRRPVPDRQRPPRGHPAPRDVLPRGDSPERSADSGAARLPPPPGLLLPRA